jgi:hypothetical protein
MILERGGLLVTGTYGLDMPARGGGTITRVISVAVSECWTSCWCCVRT